MQSESLQGIGALSVIAAVISVATVILFYVYKIYFARRRKDTWKSQLVFGLIFGLFAIAGTEFGVEIQGAVMNVRDAAPLCAGLFFGPGAGVVAGLVGGIERWFAVYWGAGAYTRVACTLGTIAAGLFGAFLKKYMFTDRLPGLLYSLGIGAVAEVIHMLLLYITHINDAATAHSILMACGPVMIPMVAISTAVPGLAITIIEGNSFKWSHKDRGIAQNIGLGILISVLFAFVITNLFQITLQNKLALQNADTLISQTLEDIKLDIDIAGNRGKDMESFLNRELSHRHIGTIGYLVAVNKEGYVVSFTEGELTEEERDLSKNMSFLEVNEEMVTRRFSYDGYDYYYAFTKCDDYYIIAMYPVIEAEFVKNVSVVVSGLLEVVVLTIVFLMIYILIRIVVVKNLDMINDDLASITSGELNTVVDVRSSTEFAELSDDINTTVYALKGYIEKAAAKFDEDLKVARNIQGSALPTVFPDDNRYEIYANMIPAKDVGGDFYDFYRVGGDDKLAFLIADVSGKGIPGAMFMMSAKSVIKSLAETGASPGVVFTKANEILCQNNDAEMFVTAWLGVMDLNTGHVIYTNAGHNPPIIKNSDGTYEYLNCKPGFVLAGIDGYKYKDYELDLEEGQSLFLYTDGVTEATDVYNELFGENRLLRTVNESGNMNMRYTCKLVKEKVDSFVGEAPQFDDITMLAIKRKTDEDRLGKLIIECNEESADQVRDFFDRFNEYYDLPIKTTTTIMVIVDEIYSNIMCYSGASTSVVTAEYGDGKVIMSFQDDGIAYDPLAKEDPDVTLSAEDRKIGGLGIYMVKQMSEDVKYTRVAGKNILDIVIVV